MRDSWNPETYHRFAAYRRRPFRDLLAGLRRDVLAPRICDLGCGTGELTRMVHDSFEGAVTTGVDRSGRMLERARRHAPEGVALDFVEADLVGFLADDANPAWDVIFSNAALHWVPDQRALFERLVGRLRPGGQLAIQVPFNDHHISHQTILDVAGRAPFVGALGGWSRTSPIEAPGWYAETLHALGCAAPRVELRVYPQELDGPEDVATWIRGTTLTPYLARLDSSTGAAFVAAVEAELRARLPDRKPFFYPYDRILVWATKGAAS